MQIMFKAISHSEFAGKLSVKHNYGCCSTNLEVRPLILDSASDGCKYKLSGFAELSGFDNQGVSR